MFRVRALWGTLTDKNNPFKSSNPDLFRFPTRDGKFTSFVMDPKVPYIEGSVGIYNIFKLLHVEYVHRFTYRDNPGINKNGLFLSVNVPHKARTRNISLHFKFLIRGIRLNSFPFIS